MKQPSKHRRRISIGAAWLCLALSALLALSWLASTRWTMFFMAAQFGDSILLKSGTFSYSWTSAELRARLSARFNEPLEPRWEWHFSERKTPIEWWTAFYVSTTSGRRAITLPLWIPFILFVSGAMLFFWSIGPSHKPGCCTGCGYDLRGLGSGDRCPECDSPVRHVIHALVRVIGTLSAQVPIFTASGLMANCDATHRPPAPTPPHTRC